MTEQPSLFISSIYNISSYAATAHDEREKGKRQGKEELHNASDHAAQDEQNRPSWSRLCNRNTPFSQEADGFKRVGDVQSWLSNSSIDVEE